MTHTRLAYMLNDAKDEAIMTAEHCRVDAIVTSYEIAMKDINFLARHKFKCVPCYRLRATPFRIWRLYKLRVCKEYLNKLSELSISSQGWDKSHQEV